MTVSFELRRPRTTSAEQLFDRYLGSLLGGAVADALGWIT
jgi:hypothetical protein